MPTFTSTPSLEEISPPTPSSPAPVSREGRVVSARAVALGLVLSVLGAALNAWMVTIANVGSIGGVQLPLGAVFALAVLILGINWPLHALNQRGFRLVAPLSRAEMATIYTMLLAATILSTSGTLDFFVTLGPGLFYFSTRENGWADTFYRFLPRHYAPGWDGHVFQREVIDAFYVGGLSRSQIPWHAWTLMLLSWGVLLGLVTGAFFFLSLLLRRQWIENESLTFPLLELPLQMVDSSDERPTHSAFWTNRALWMGVVLAFGVHFLRGMNHYFPDWPIVPGFHGPGVDVEFTEMPFLVLGKMGINILLGAVGVAYLLSREVSFSMWFCFFLVKAQLVLAQMSGYPPSNLPKDLYLGRPTFITHQSIGGWAMMAAMLLWTARGHVGNMARAALRPRSASALLSNEPFAPRVVMGGLALCALGTLGWCVYAGINPLLALLFFALYGAMSVVLARLVLEAGMIFPQFTFSSFDVLTGLAPGAGAMGGANLTRLSFLQTSLFGDARSNSLPVFLTALKLAHAQGLDGRNTRRLMGAALLAALTAMAVCVLVDICALYSHGALASYSWFTKDGPQSTFSGVASLLRGDSAPNAGNWAWFAVGAFVVWAMLFLRTRFLWFPLHPLGYIVASGYAIGPLYTSFFIGWLLKVVMVKYGGHDRAQALKPFMIGLILGNACAMMLWIAIGTFAGSYIQYFPA